MKHLTPRPTPSAIPLPASRLSTLHASPPLLPPRAPALALRASVALCSVPPALPHRSPPSICPRVPRPSIHPAPTHVASLVPSRRVQPYTPRTAPEGYPPSSMFRRLQPAPKRTLERRLHVGAADGSGAVGGDHAELAVVSTLLRRLRAILTRLPGTSHPLVDTPVINSRRQPHATFRRIPRRRAGCAKVISLSQPLSATLTPSHAP